MGRNRFARARRGGDISPHRNPSPKGRGETRLVLRLGTRGSALALAQSGVVARELERAHRRLGLTVQLVTIATTGDRDKRADFAGRGIFVKELEQALRGGRIDLAVHSLKDMPVRLPRGLALAAVTRREDARDVAITRAGWSLATLPAGAVVGTSSPRRRAQLGSRFPRLRFEDIRGNIETRLRKVASGAYDAAILAHAGLKRLGWRVGPGGRTLTVVAQASSLPDCRQDAGATCVPQASSLPDCRQDAGATCVAQASSLPDYRQDAGATCVAQASSLPDCRQDAGATRSAAKLRLELLPLAWVLPAPGQGALALECRAQDARTRRLARAVHAPETDACLRAERACLAALGGGCRLPLGAHAVLAPNGRRMRLRAALARPDGSGMTLVEVLGPASRPEALGRRAAKSMQRAHADEDEED